ncbi:MAG TPA: histidine kinase [Thermoanaerobaculia bacterium]|nr:histidine kinase [Thermoanaerobaculia bacterium]
MAQSPSSQARSERLIAAGRVVLAASSLLAVWIDPSEPAKHAQTAYGLLVAYLGYSVVVALLVGRAGTLPGWQRPLSHAFDLVFFTLFVYFTAGPSSPFIAYFVFSLTCATLRWGWRGTLLTAVVALSAFVGVGVYFAEVLRDPAFQLHDFIIRGVYLAVVAALLGYLGAHEERIRSEMAFVAAWAAATEERIRLARDLHDGVLQSLTGFALRLVAVERQVATDPQVARQRLEDLRRLMALEQRDLRFFIQELRPEPGSREGTVTSLGTRLEELMERIEREWDLRVELQAENLPESAPDGLGRDVYHIVREAVVNAVRHGEASQVQVRVAGEGDGGVSIEVRDNGRGFPFAGRYTQDTLDRLDLGPRNLRERVAALAGSLELQSGPGGACLAIVLPGLEAG